GIDTGKCVVESNAKCYIIRNVETRSRSAKRKHRDHEYTESYNQIFYEPQRTESPNIVPHTFSPEFLCAECLAHVRVSQRNESSTIGRRYSRYLGIGRHRRTHPIQTSVLEPLTQTGGRERADLFKTACY